MHFTSQKHYILAQKVTSGFHCQFDHETPKKAPLIQHCIFIHKISLQGKCKITTTSRQKGTLYKRDYSTYNVLVKVKDHNIIHIQDGILDDVMPEEIMEYTNVIMISTYKAHHILKQSDICMY